MKIEINPENPAVGSWFLPASGNHVDLRGYHEFMNLGLTNLLGFEATKS